LRFVYRKCDNRPRPFFIFALFLIMVFGFRFCIEFIKEPQSGPTEALMLSTIGLKMGQVLSAPFLIFGFIALYLSTRQKQPDALIENIQPAIKTPHPHPKQNLKQQQNNNNEVNRPQQSNIKPKKKKKK